MNRILGIFGIVLALAGFLGSSCKPNEKKNNDTILLALAGIAATSVKVNSAAELAVESNDNYDNNEYGLVTATTIKRWRNDWANQKPAAITGNLIILQSTQGATVGQEFIKPTSGVYVYDWPNGGGTDINFRQRRNNGLFENVQTGLPDGARTDAFLKLYRIDLSKDLVVFASGKDTGAGTTASPKGSTYQTLGRGLYWLRYWGADAKHVAVLDGPIDTQFSAADLTAVGTESSPPNDGTFSVKSFRAVDNSVLVQPVENIIKIVRNPNSHGVSGLTSSVFIADARHNTTSTEREFVGTTDGTGANEIESGKKALTEGHLKGAFFAPWLQVVDQTTGRFKSKAAIAALWSNPSGWGHAENGSVSGYQQGQTYLHYCRTNARSMVTGLSTFVILGRPSVFYENSFIEWNGLSANHPDPTKRTLPAGSPFATDTVDLTVSTGGSGGGPTFNTTNAANYKTVINPNATTSRQTLIDDWNYKIQ
ncbi:rhodanese [Leptospira yasudae]|uniref:rhodanese n=1 Tax=Leptospira yasudae TaxID=2202201 RepID=UPI0011C39898|nr:rhodanese [Leptospira yasudae]